MADIGIGESPKRFPKAMNEFPAVLFFGVIFLLWMPRLGWSAALPAIVTLAPLLASLYIIASSDFTASQQKWAFGTASVILGYWLKPKEQ